MNLILLISLLDWCLAPRKVNRDVMIETIIATNNDKGLLSMTVFLLVFSKDFI